MQSEFLVVCECLTFGLTSCVTPSPSPPVEEPTPPVVVVPVKKPVPVEAVTQTPPLPNAAPRDPLALFAYIKIDMPRTGVESIFGSPTVADVERNGLTEVWYMAPPPITKPNLPKDGLGSVFVAYKDGRVFQKRLNPQLQ